MEAERLRYETNDDSNAALRLVVSVVADADNSERDGGQAAWEGAESEDDERHQIARRLLSQMEAISTDTGWSRGDLTLMLGCEHADPELWHEVEPALLEQSVEVVSFLHEAMTHASDGRRPENLADRLSDGARDEDRLALNAIGLQIARLEAAREALYLCIEIVARAGGDLEIARAVATVGGPGPAPVDFVALGQLGAARHEALRRIRAYELRNELSADQQLQLGTTIASADVRLLVGDLATQPTEVPPQSVLDDPGYVARIRAKVGEQTQDH